MNWLSQNYAQVLDLLFAHTWLSLAAIVLSFLIAVPLGWVITQWKLGRGAAIALVGAVYAIPSLPMFIIIPVLFGVPIRSAVTMITVLTAYGVALLTRSAADAFSQVPKTLRLSANAMGFSPVQRFFQVELISALPAIIAGLRVVVVSTVSLVTVGAVVGIQSLGTLLTDGFQRGIVAEVVTGLVLTVVLAVLFDAICQLLEKLLLPWKSVVA